MVTTAVAPLPISLGEMYQILFHNIICYKLVFFFFLLDADDVILVSPLSQLQTLVTAVNNDYVFALTIEWEKLTKIYLRIAVGEVVMG